MLHKLTSLGLLAFLSLATAQHMNNKVVDLTTKKGYLLYKASYENVAAQRTEAFVPNVKYDRPTGTDLILSDTIAENAVYTFEVEKKDWLNIFSIETSVFPPDSLKTGFLPAGQAIVDETYSVTALDPSSKALLGSLVFGANYAAQITGATTGNAKVVFPVLGASGVFKQAKSVLIEYKANGIRDVSIYKNVL